MIIALTTWMSLYYKDTVYDSIILASLCIDISILFTFLEIIGS